MLYLFLGITHGYCHLEYSPYLALSKILFNLHLLSSLTLPCQTLPSYQ